MYHLRGTTNFHKMRFGALSVNETGRKNNAQGPANSKPFATGGI